MEYGIGYSLDGVRYRAVEIEKNVFKRHSYSFIQSNLSSIAIIGIVIRESNVLIETNFDAVTVSDENFSANILVADAAGVAAQISTTANPVAS